MSIFNILSWVLFGALAGWVASLIVGTNRRQNLFADIAIGIMGSLLGGVVMQLLTGQQFGMQWSLKSFAVAVLGAVLLLSLTGWYRSGRRNR